MQLKELEKQTEFLLLAALRKCGNLEDAQDITQDTLLAALTYLSNGNTISDMRGWLLTVLNRKYYYILRQKYKFPVVSPDEWKTLREIIQTTYNDFSNDIIELLREFLKDKKQEIPKHLVSVPLQKQYMRSHGALLMATVRRAMKDGLIYDGNYDDDTQDNQCPYPMVFVVEK